MEKSLKKEKVLVSQIQLRVYFVYKSGIRFDYKVLFLLSLPGPDKELLHVVQKYRFENLVMFLSPLNKGGSPGTIRECRNKGGMRGTQHTDLAQILRPSFFV